MTPAALQDDQLGNFMAASLSGGIERQEKEGQTRFVASDKLPIDGVDKNRQQLEALGFKFGSIVDKIFIECTLPQGWKKVASEHSMWSYLHDDKGRERAAIFFKAAFYDYNAHIRFTQAVQYKCMLTDGRGRYDHNYGTAVSYVGVVTHQGKEVFCSSEIKVIDQLAGWDASDKLNEIARAWMIEHYPNHTDSFTYWD